MKQIMILFCVIFSFMTHTGASHMSIKYPEMDMNNKCKTPKGEDGKCLRISDCNPQDRFLYITEDRRTTQFLRYPIWIHVNTFYIVCFFCRDSACGFEINTPKICCTRNKKHVKSTTLTKILNRVNGLKIGWMKNSRLMP